MLFLLSHYNIVSTILTERDAKAIFFTPFVINQMKTLTNSEYQQLKEKISEYNNKQEEQSVRYCYKPYRTIHNYYS